jgi:integrase
LNRTGYPFAENSGHLYPQLKRNLFQSMPQCLCAFRGCLTNIADDATPGDTKNGDMRVLPLAGEAFTLLKKSTKVRSIDIDRIFPPSKEAKKSPYINLDKSFKAALNAAQIKDVRWHGLRHTAASYLTMAGASPLQIYKILGHRIMQMVNRYSHLSPESVIELGDLLAEKMGVA